MIKASKMILSLAATLIFTWLYYKDFYINEPLLLNVILLFGLISAFLLSLPKTKGVIFFIATLLIPFVTVFVFTYNFLFALFALVLSFLFALCQKKKDDFTKILFTQNNKPVFIKYYYKKSFSLIMRKWRNAFSLLILVIFALGFMFPIPNQVWLTRAFPINLSEKEVFCEEVVPSGLITTTAWYDDNALLVADFFPIAPDIPSPGKTAGLKVGDAIVKINGERALSSDFIVNGADFNEAILTVVRNNDDGVLEEVDITVTPVFSEEDCQYRIGISYYSSAILTASTQTLSFFYKSNGYFAATAHSSDDIYSNVDILKGILTSSIARGRDDKGLIAIPTEEIGKVSLTNNYGAYGKLLKSEGDAIVLGKKSDFSLGKATMLSAFEGGDVLEYEVYILGTYRINSRDVLFLNVTDERIRSAGGITRGMSGSPIIQNGKLIGALSNMDEGGYTAYATFCHDMAHEIFLNENILNS